MFAAARPFEREIPAFHPDYLRMLCALLEEEGGDVRAVLQQAGLDAADLDADGPMLPLSRARWLILALERAAARPTLALEAGSRVRPSWHGPLGTALRHSASLREALGLIERHAALRTRCFEARLEPVTGGLRYAIEPGVPLGDVRRFVLEHVLASTIGLVRALADAGPDSLKLELPWSRPAWHAAYRVLAGAVRFDAPALSLVLPDKVLDRPNPHADAASCLGARWVCEDQAVRAAAPPSVTQHVRSVLDASVGVSDLTLSHVARRLGTSSRTLVRHLNAEGSNFQQLLDDARRDRALRLLDDGARTIADVALALGYRSPSNFGRSFRRWVGVTPTAYRAGLGR